MSETGAIKFRYDSDDRGLTPFPGFKDANAAREELRRIGCLGRREDGIGFGNLSLRDESGKGFYITGSGTGNLMSLGIDDYARIVAWDFRRNWLRCEGRAKPSAESLTHAAIYESDPQVAVVLHGHHSSLWRQLLDLRRATAPDVAYGTPAMAAEVRRLFQERTVREWKLFAMGGHEDGVIAFAAGFRDALEVLTSSIRPFS
jgi:L-ribulose-5-phosphate 4-epimerase